VVWATRKFQHYLLGTIFTLETDHKPLEWLESHKQSYARSQRLEQWSLELCAFNFNVAYRPGNNNQCADLLSQLPVSVVAWESPLSKQELLDAQEQDPILSVVRQQLLLQDPDSVPTSSSWKKFPLCHYRQLWPQLILNDSILYRVMKSPTMIKHKKLIVVPQSLNLEHAHDLAGHPGMDRTLTRLMQTAYWVGMPKDVGHYYSCCLICQAHPTPLQPVIASRPWEMVAVDVLKVSTSPQGNGYLLVAKDYFSKWPFAMPMPDQKAERIVKTLRDHIFTMVGPPEKLHSDQGRNFESQILADLCKAFQITKSRTTPYHSMGDGLVE